MILGSRTLTAALQWGTLLLETAGVLAIFPRLRTAIGVGLLAFYAGVLLTFDYGFHFNALFTALYFLPFDRWLPQRSRAAAVTPGKVGSVAKIFLLLTVLPLVELALLLLLGKYTSVGFTLTVVILTGLTGTILIRYQGLQTYRNIQRDLSAHRMPTESLIDALMIFLAGVLLITPGVLTDLVGLSLLVPAVRRAYQVWIVAWLRAKFQLVPTSTPGGGSVRGEVIDSYVVERQSPPNDNLEKNP